MKIFDPSKLNSNLFKAFINFYPPYIGAGIRADEIADDFSRMVISMRLRWYNRNYVGTHFGGSLNSMSDPFFMLILLKQLGDDYLVWDKSSHIDFVKPGRGKVSVVFEIPKDQLDTIRAETAQGQKYLPQFVAEIKDEAGDVVARVTKTLYVRLKPEKPSRPSSTTSA